MNNVLYFVMLICGVTAEFPTAEERKEIVELHAQLRESVDPPARKMMFMNYSIELEKLAHDWAANCSFAELSVYSLPNDIFATVDSFEEKPTFEEFLKGIVSQKELYNYEQNYCRGYCYDYKVMVLEAANAVGCARRKCFIKSSPTHFTNLVLCLYKPAHKPGGLPYESGESCSDCPTGFQCYRKQCLKTLTQMKTSNKKQALQQARTAFEVSDIPTSFSSSISSFGILLIQTLLFFV
uniref:SCP domain-containing protein n=1 Tax=Mesocestoides corti TaxID=53468 RepID=A0A5K3FRG0_MESCO